MMKNRMARVVSFLFHPLVIPVYVLLILLNFNAFHFQSIPIYYKMVLVGVVIITTLLLPLGFTWLLVRFQLVSSSVLTVKEERIYPVLAVSVFYFITYYLLKGIYISTIFSSYMLGATLLAILSLMISFYRKISLHMIAVGSFTGLFLGLALKYGINLYPELYCGILISGILGWARLTSDKRRPGEIYSGFALGIIVITVLIILI